MALAMQQAMASASLQSSLLTSTTRSSPTLKVAAFSPLASTTVSRRALRVKASAETPPPPPSAETPSIPAVPAVPASPPPPTFESIMAFDGIPEIVNGRLAMLGFAAGAFLELHNKLPFPYQLSHNGLLYFGFTTILISAASVIPALKGASPKKKEFAFFTEGAEKINGRVAMLGLVGIVLLESIGKFSLASL